MIISWTPERIVFRWPRPLSRGKGGTWELGTPKTTASCRSIPLPPSVIESLKQHRVRQLEQRLKLGEVWEDHDFVFTNATGGSLHVNSTMNEFAKLIARAGVRTICFHDLHHTCAIQLMPLAESPKVVQGRLGHSNISITLGLYSHVTLDMQRAVADRLDAALSAKSTSEPLPLEARVKQS
jgi:integrase